jgi:hypothetical protein
VLLESPREEEEEERKAFDEELLNLRSRESVTLKPVSHLKYV